MPARCWPAACKAALLLNTEPEFDSGRRRARAARWARPRWSSTLSPFKANLRVQRRAAAHRAVHRNARHLRQCRRPRAEFPRRGQAAGRNAPGLEGAARAGQPAGPAGLRLRSRRDVLARAPAARSDAAASRWCRATAGQRAPRPRASTPSVQRAASRSTRRDLPARRRSCAARDSLQLTGRRQAAASPRARRRGACAAAALSARRLA